MSGDDQWYFLHEGGWQEKELGNEEPLSLVPSN